MRFLFRRRAVVHVDPPKRLLHRARQFSVSRPCAFPRYPLRFIRPSDAVSGVQYLVLVRHPGGNVFVSRWTGGLARGRRGASSEEAKSMLHSGEVKLTNR
jgi:hypothetical protein